MADQRPKIQGLFPYEGVSFGYVYWPPKSSHSVISSEASVNERSWEFSPRQAEGEFASENFPTPVPFSTLPGYSATDPLVLVHGFGQSARSWEPVVACLDPGRPVWAFELLGHGISERPGRGDAYELDFQGRALLAFLGAVAKGAILLAAPVLQAGVLTSPVSQTSFQKLALVGYSMGGRVVLAAAAQSKQFARVVSDVVLESVGLGSPSPKVRAVAAQKDAFHAAKLREEGLEAFFAYWEELPLFASQKLLPPEMRQAIRKERLANSPQALAASFEHAGQHAMPLRPEIYQRLQNLCDLGVSLNYLVGEKDSKYVALAFEAAQTIDLPITIVPGCGHNIHAELISADTLRL